MQKDYLKELEHLGLIARLKRLSDGMLQEIREVYSQEDVDLEPNWHFVFLKLKKEGSSTMSEMAEAFRLSQPAVVKIINKMKERGYILVKEDKTDGRKKHLSLSKKAMNELPRFEKIWNCGRASIEEMLGPDSSLMPELASLERQLQETPFHQRIQKHLSQRK